MGKTPQKDKEEADLKNGVKKNESNEEWLNVGERTTITFRVDDENLLFLAVVASVEIDEMTVKYADTSKPLLNADGAEDNMDGAFHGVHLMESRPEGRILDDEDNLTQTTFTDKDEFNANSKGGDVLFASFL